MVVFVLMFSAMGGAAGILGSTLSKKSGTKSDTEISQTADTNQNGADNSTDVSVSEDQDDGKLLAVGSAKTIKYDICAPSKTVPPASVEAGGYRCYSIITVLSLSS